MKDRSRIMGSFTWERRERWRGGGGERERERERKIPQNACLVQKHFLPAHGEPSIQHSRICQIFERARFCRTKLMFQNRISQVLGKVHLFNFFEKSYLTAQARNAKYYRIWLRYCLLDRTPTVLQNFPNFLAVSIWSKTARKSISLFQKS